MLRIFLLHRNQVPLLKNAVFLISGHSMKSEIRNVMMSISTERGTFSDIPFEL